MLIQFAVENYGSIRDRQEISFVASSIKDDDSVLIDRRLPGLAGVRFLRAAAVCGANAAGKSTLLRALRSLQGLVLESYGRGAQEAMPYTPFALDDEHRLQPTVYEIDFVAADGIRYHYELGQTADRICHELLEAFPNGRAQLWFSRDDRAISGSTYVSVPQAALQLLNDTVPLLSFLANYQNLRAYKKVSPVYLWFRDQLLYLNRGSSGQSEISFSGEIVDGMTGTDAERSYIQRMVRQADLGIARVGVVSRKLPAAERETLMRMSGLPEDKFPETMKFVVFDHVGESGDTATFEMGSESDGTNRIFDLSGFIARALGRGATIVIDELDASLHPNLLTALVESFQDPNANPHNAQLLFSSLNPVVLKRGLLRRDQVWFATKSGGATEVYPLTEFSPRKGEAIEQGYLAGRYAAVPTLPDTFAYEETSSGD